MSLIELGMRNRRFLLHKLHNLVALKFTGSALASADAAKPSQANAD
jgi:hypothetical protein